VVDDGLAFLRLAEVGGEDVYLGGGALDLSLDLLEPLAVKVDEEDGCALGRRELRRCLADPRSRNR
jgi:hypothetical protein